MTPFKNLISLKMGAGGSGGGSNFQTTSVSYTPSESQQTAQVKPDSGYDALSKVNVTVGAISSSYVGSAIDRRDSTDLSASGATVTAPAGYYESAATKSVASGTAGTPSASKGAVSNHSVSITPSVTNTAGYISGGTITGTAVTVDVTELESGTKSITENGTGISVSGYSAVDVNVSGGGGGDDYADFTAGNIQAIISHGTEYVLTDYMGSMNGLYSFKFADNSVTNYEGYWMMANNNQAIGVQRNGGNNNIVLKYHSQSANGVNYPNYQSGGVVNVVYSTIGMAEVNANKVMTFGRSYYQGNLESQISAYTFYGLNMLDEDLNYYARFMPWLENGVPCIKEVISGNIYYNSGTGGFDYIDWEGVTHYAQ